MKNFLKVSVVNVLRYAIILIPFWWFLGINSIVFHLIVYVLFVGLLISHEKKGKLNIPRETLILGFFILTYIFSIVINFKEIPLSRLIATLYNLSFWIEGFFLVIIIYNVSLTEKDIVKIAKSFMFLGLLCGLLSIVGMFLWLLGHKSIILFSPLKMLIPDHIYIMNNLFGRSLACTIISSDYTAFGLLPRSSLFFVYATALGMIMIITIPMTVYYYKMKNKFSKSVIPLLIQVFALFFSLSRIAIVGLFFSYVMVNFIIQRKTYFFIGSIFLTMAIIILLAHVFPEASHHVVSSVKGFRKGSTATRIYMYEKSIKKTLQRPFCGYGFKPRLGSSGIPLASHSTFVSIFYKTGIVGLIFLLFMWWNVYQKWKKGIKKVKNKSLFYLGKYLGVIFMGGLIWQITEDLDAPPIVVFLYFIVIGLILSFWKIKPEVLHR